MKAKQTKRCDSRRHDKLGNKVISKVMRVIDFLTAKVALKRWK